MYGQDEAFVVVVLLIGFVVLTVFWIAEFFSGGDR